MQIPKSGIFLLSKVVTKVVLANAQMYVEIINYGATIYGIYLPAKTNGFENIVLNYENMKAYFTDKFYIGATIGRVAGRINEGHLPVHEQIYQLTKNENGKHHLHGGHKGFNTKIFEVLSQEDLSGKSVTKMRAFSKDGEEGYPGNLELTVTYTLSDSNSLSIEYQAICDQPTHVNITNHTYFNLCGTGGSALDQQLQINANEILETDNEFIPLGNSNTAVCNTPYDFTNAVAIKHQKGKLERAFYNDCYRLSKKNDVDAVLFDSASGRKMTVSTSYPSILFYSGDYLGEPFNACDGICLEAQFNPDAPNQHNGLLTLLNPGNTYFQHINWSFSWQ